MDKMETAKLLLRVKKRLEKIQEEYDNYAEAMKDVMSYGEELELKGGKIKFIEVPMLEVYPEKLSRKLSFDKFIQCVKVNLSQTKKFLGEKALYKMGKLGSYDKLLVTIEKEKV